MKSFTPKHIEAAVLVLHKARTDNQVKLRFGHRHRTKIIEQIAAKDESYKEDYRYAWLKNTRNRLVRELSVSAKEFQQFNQHDIISVNDMIDVAESLLVVLKSNSLHF